MPETSTHQVNESQAAENELKKPIFLQILALSFLVAPLGNIIISLAMSGIDGWYAPKVFLPLVATIPLLEWSWLVLVFVSGVLLFIQHKTAWAVAVGTLLVVLGINTYKSFFMMGAFTGPTFMVKAQLIISVITTFAVLLVMFYARYPYLDRRDTWFGKAAARFPIRTATQVIAQDIFDGVTESLSVSGARLRLQKDLGAGAHDLQFVDVIFPDIKNIKTKAQVVEYKDNVLRVRFRGLSKDEKRVIQDWLKKVS